MEPKSQTGQLDMTPSLSASREEEETHIIYPFSSFSMHHNQWGCSLTMKIPGIIARLSDFSFCRWGTLRVGEGKGLSQGQVVSGS